MELSEFLCGGVEVETLRISMAIYTKYIVDVK
jgi:hypothetical protein